MFDRNHFLPRPPGPLFGLWSWRYLNKFKTLKLVSSKRVKSFYEEFKKLYPPGSKFPTVELKTSDGRVVKTSDLLGKKHFVLFTGAIT